MSATLSAAPITYTAVMNGAGENPATGSPATGSTTVIIDTATHFLNVTVTFAGLIGGNASAGHIHCCAAAPNNVGVAVPYVGFPAATSGLYLHTFDLTDPSSYTAAFLTFGGGTAAGAEAALALGLANGQAYSNIHNSTFPGGEIRGQLAAVPEPGT
ncbi:MAG: CHRD domain-containing protein, partial [Acidobacteriota bacterium]